MATSTSLSNLETLVDRHMKLREVSDRILAQNESGRQSTATGREAAFITVSRQLGAGGTGLAQQLAAEMEWQLFDKEILEAIARNAHTRMRVLSGMDEHLQGRLEEFINHLIVPESINQFAFVREMSQVILSLGKGGNAVIVGRGANWLLAGEPGVRLRVVAPLEARVRRVMERSSVTEDKARKAVLDESRTTADFIRKIFGRDVDDPLGYDLVLNLDRLSTAAAVSAVRSALKRQ